MNWLESFIKIENIIYKFFYDLILGKKLFAQISSKKRIHIIGSAPGPKFFKNDVNSFIICVNSSVTRIKQIPNILILTDQLFLNFKNANQISCSIMNGKKCKTLIVIKRSFSHEQIMLNLEKHNIKYERLIIINNLKRSLLIMKIAGFKSFFLKKYRPSNGVFALILVYTLRIISLKDDYLIKVNGINPDTLGHYYQQNWMERGHVDSDKTIIKKLNQSHKIKFEYP